MLTKSRGISLLAVAFAMAFLLSARIARADDVSNVHHDGQWSTDKDNGFKGNKGDFDNKDWDRWVAKDNDGGKWDKDGKDKDKDTNGGAWDKDGKDTDGGIWDWDKDGKGDDGKDNDHSPKSVPEPSSLVLLTIGVFGLTALARRQRSSGVRQLA